MMRRVSVGVVALAWLLAFATSAAAECAWVLWTFGPSLTRPRAGLTQLLRGRRERDARRSGGRYRVDGSGARGRHAGTQAGRGARDLSMLPRHRRPASTERAEDGGDQPQDDPCATCGMIPAA
jgi:hypothetical protein